MTVQTTERLVIYQGNGATTDFPFSFLIPEDTLSVSIINWTSKAVEEVLTLADYSVSGLGDPLGGTVTYNPMAGALPSDKGLLILRTVPFTQDLDIEPFGGFNPDTLEAQLDQIVMQVQQINETQNRSLVVLPGQTPPDVAVIAAASGNAANAAASAVLAEQSATKAQEWAENPEDAEVDPGQYSALHWAAKAQELRDQVDALLATGRVPLGTIIHSAIPQTDNGFLLCDGAPVTALYPDLRAALIAAGNPFGVSGADPLLPDEVTVSRFRRAANGSIPLGTVQDDQFQGHVFGDPDQPTFLYDVMINQRLPALGIDVNYAIHTQTTNPSDSAGAGNNARRSPITDGVNGTPRVGNETRPKSIAYLPYIKAFGAITIEGMADLSQLLNAIATEAEAILGTNNTKLMTPLRTKQAVAAYNKWKDLEVFDVASDSAVADYRKLNLSEFISLNIEGSILTTSAAAVSMQTSTDNGVSWLSTSDHYSHINGIINGTASSGAGATAAALLLSYDNIFAGSELSISSSMFFSFNKNRRGRLLSDISFVNSSGNPETVRVSSLTPNTTAGLTARNAIKLAPSAGNIYGVFVLSGREG